MTHVKPDQRRLATLLLLLILTAAAGLRFYRLEAQSFWNDEGNSARIAERSIKLILEGAAGDIHPPLYYLALHFWRAVAGQSEFALRSFSAVGGVGLVALIYALGARMFSRPAGLAAAFLAAINPFQVYYSQEARSYIWVAFLGAAAVYCAGRFLDSRFKDSKFKTFWAAGYVLAITAGLYTHYLFLIVLVPINLTALAQIIRACFRCFVGRVGNSSGGDLPNHPISVGRVGNSSRGDLQNRPTNKVKHTSIIKCLWRWVGLHIIAGILYLPWLPIAVRQITTWPAAGGEAALGPALLDIFHLLSLGSTIETAGSTIALLGFGLLLLLALIPQSPTIVPEAKRSGIRRSPIYQLTNLPLTILWLLIPITLVFALDLYKPAFLKFLLVASPAFCLLLGRGISWGLRPQSTNFPISQFPILFPLAFSAGLILSFSYESLHNLYTDPAYARTDYRGMAQYVQSVARPDDGIILNAANQWEVFTYYYPHVERVYPLPRSRPVNEPQVVAELESITAEHDRLFAIFWAEAESDPQRVVERWLDAHAYKATDEWWGDVRLVIYAVPSAPAAEVETSLEARFGDEIVLQGYTLLADSLAPADILQITLFWQTLAPIAQRYKVFLHLLNSDGVLVAQRDSEPGGGLALTTTWSPGQTQIDNHGVLIPAGTPPGEYQLTVGMYPLGDPAGRVPITLAGEPAGDTLSIHPITIIGP